jgi:hypothetical protein
MISDIFKKDLLERAIDFRTDVVKVALMTKNHQYHASDAFWCNVRHNEIKGRGYKEGGRILRNVKFERSYNNICLKASDIAWENAVFTTRGIVLYFEYSEKIIGSTDFDKSYTVEDALFKLEWSPRGVLSEYHPDEPPQYLTYCLN